MRNCFVPPAVLNRIARSRPDAVASCSTSHRLRETRSSNGVTKPVGATQVVILDADHRDNFSGAHAPKDGDAAATDAAQWSSATLEMLAEHDYNGIDGKGRALVAYVHFGEAFMNAFWDGARLVFGDGDGRLFESFAASPEVVAHEIGHAIVQHTAGLVYKGQPGALNEHFADVIGSALQQRVGNKDRADWLIGNEIMGPELKGEALRSMAWPGTAYNHDLMGRDPQRAHMDSLYIGDADSGGVHINSGIMNRMFVAVADGVGPWVAFKLWLDALKALWPDARFTDAASVLVDRAKGMDGAPPGLRQLVRAAAREVGLQV